MVVDLSLEKKVSHKFAMDMELNPSHGIPKVVYYQPAHHHDYEHVIHFTMKDAINTKNIIKFMNDIKEHEINRDSKYEKDYKMVSDVMVQDISYHNIKSKAFTVLKKNYDLVILFYFKSDWKETHSKKA